MAIRTADFDAGTNGNTIATGDTAHGNVWTSVTGTPTYDTTHAAHGANAANLVVSSAQKVLNWGSVSYAEHWGRLYAYYTANPGSNGIYMYRSGPSNGMSFYVKSSATAGDIVVRNGAAVLGTSTNTITLNAWIRIEWHVLYNTGSSGSVELKLYNTADSTTATETMTYTGLTSPQSAATSFDFGQWAGAATISYWLDQIVEGATAYPGPFPVSTTSPVISGSAPVGSTLTCDGGAWNTNATFTLTYQWTSDGGNIGGATSSTYVTQAGDATHAVGCTVTATGVQATNESASQASSNTITPTAVAGVVPSGFGFDFH
jgi:hypothetical protein